MYTPFYREIRPEGWLRRQLEIQAGSLSGHLHEIWPDVRDSAWIGASCEGWERVPYWLDGLIPLAYLLDDPALKDTADGVERKHPFCDYELIPQSAWNYGFAGSQLVLCEQDVDAVPFSSSHPPLVIHCAMAKVDWPLADGYDSVPATHPASQKAISQPEEQTLIPYGCAKLRMTEMPLLRS